MNVFNIVKYLYSLFTEKYFKVKDSSHIKQRKDYKLVLTTTFISVFDREFTLTHPSRPYRTCLTLD